MRHNAPDGVTCPARAAAGVRERAPDRTVFPNRRSRVKTLKLNHLHLKTKDPDKTAKFYVDTLGAKIVNKNPQGGYRLDLHGLSLNVSNFLVEQKREQRYGMEHLAIDTDELDTIVEKLKAQGIHILEQTVVSGGRRVCFFEGPDGVQLEFIEMK